MDKQPKVVHISDDECQLTLNVGKEDGVSMKDLFLVYSLSEHEIIDPDTKQSLGYLEFVKGTGQVIHLMERMCTIASTKYKRPTPTKTIRKERSSIFASSIMQPTVEETVIEGEEEQLPFADVQMYDLAKRI